MKRNHRVNNATLPPRTPTIPAPPSQTGDAATIYRELLWWRDRARAMERMYHAECKRFTKFRSKGIARAIAKQMVPNHNPKVSQ